MVAPVPVVQERLPGTIARDVRGEQLIYHDDKRTASIIWTWNSGNYLYRSSLTHWWYTNDRRSVALTAEEHERLMERFLRYATTQLGPTTVSE